MTDDLQSLVRTVLRDVGRIVAPNGIDEERYVTLGGTEQWIQLRGQDRASPILLFLHGGPGSPISEVTWTYQRPWEDLFTVVSWDQRGFGRSWGSTDLTGTLNQEQLVSDTVELIEHLCAELGQPKVVLVGQSWGTVLALEVAHRRPDLLHVVVTQGLAVRWMASPELHYARLVADSEGEERERLVAVGPPPPVTEVEALLAWPRAMAVGFPDANTWHNIRGEGDGWARRLLTLSRISPDAADLPERDPEQLLARYQEAMASVLPWDADVSIGTVLSVPIVVMMGAHDWQTHVDLARDYFDRLEAPWKRWVEMPHAAHALNIEQPGLVLVSLVTDVLPATRA